MTLWWPLLGHSVQATLDGSGCTRAVDTNLQCSGWVRVVSGAVYKGTWHPICVVQDALVVELKQLLCAVRGLVVACRDLYQCSCQELDTLVAECKKHGALGSRLTGAGWGGCTVSLVRQADTAQFIAAIKANYFENCIREGKVKEDQLEEVIFASKAASGGAIIKLQI